MIDKESILSQSPYEFAVHLFLEEKFSNVSNNILIDPLSQFLTKLQFQKPFQELYRGYSYSFLLGKTVTQVLV